MNIHEIKKQYPSLQKWSDTHALSFHSSIQEQQLIKEFLYTVDPKKTGLQLVKQVGYDIGYLSFIRRGDTVIKLKFTFKGFLKENLQKVNTFFEKFGWYPAFIEARNGGPYSKTVANFLDFKNVSIYYEAKYDREIVPSQEYIYHLTPDIKWKAIQAFGLTPKTQGKRSDHPGRIYLLENIEDPDVDIEEIAFTLLDGYEYKEKVKEMLLLKIDLSKLKKHRFFEDVNFYMGNAIWTYENIPPFAISIERKIDVVY